MRVLVTGATGYLGRAIVRALAARGHTPVTFARSARPQEGIAAVQGDVRDAAAVRQAASGCDGICHTAALVSLWRPDPREFDAVNVGGLQNVLAVAADLRIARIVYTSSFLALPPSGRPSTIQANDYQRTKLAARQVALRAIEGGAPLVCVYPGVIYGPGELTEGNLIGRMLADHLAGRLPGLIGPERLWSYAYVEDVAEGHVAALERGAAGGHYRLGGENAPQRRVFEMLEARTGRRPPRRIPYAVADLAARVYEWRASALRMPPLLTRGVVEIFRYDWALDSERAVRDLGYRMTPLASGAARILDAVTGRATP